MPRFDNIINAASSILTFNAGLMRQILCGILKKNPSGGFYMYDLLRKKLDEADAILIGGGAGLSASAGFTYDKERFDKYFFDFGEKYGYDNIYEMGFYPFETQEESWGFWCRNIYVNRYMPIPNSLYADLLDLVKEKNYFVITTNVDHCFQKAGFDKERLFYTQGDYGLFQCDEPCCQKTWDNKELIIKMLESEGITIAEDGGLIFPKDGTLKMTVSSDLIPTCPYCGGPVKHNLRSDETFVEDEGWHKAAKAYQEFVLQNKDKKLVLLELGVGFNTPGIIKYPFWRYTKDFPDTTFVSINNGINYISKDILGKTISFEEDIREVLKHL